MTPHDVAADRDVLLRFQQEVAYLDRIAPFVPQRQEDLEVLQSRAGVLVVAWLWPNAFYMDDCDPFADSMLSDEHKRNRQRQIVGNRFQRIVDSVAEAVGHSGDDLRSYLEWATPLSTFELNQLLRGYAPFDLHVITRLCSVLHLEFDTQWDLVDPTALAGRVDRALLAHALSGRLRDMTLEDLRELATKLPGPRDVSVVADDVAAPKPGTRYASLFEALRADSRDVLTLSLDEVDEILRRSGEAPLPASARTHRAWWAGTGAKSAGRPQVSAWWAAGYRVDEVIQDAKAGETAAVRFTRRLEHGQISTASGRPSEGHDTSPAAVRTPIYPFSTKMLAQWDAPARARLAATLSAVADYARVMRPEDDDLQQLVALLDKAEFVDRGEIERHFSEELGRPVDPTWLTNLLTRARRQNWAANVGTRSQPQWVPVKSKALVAADIAEILALDAPELGPGSTLPADFFQAVGAAVDVDTSGLNGAQAARAIVEAKGRTWKPEFESQGSTVTVAGLEALRDAVHLGPDGSRRWLWRKEWDEA